jgi:hypothetical protein
MTATTPVERVSAVLEQVIDREAATMSSVAPRIGAHHSLEARSAEKTICNARERNYRDDSGERTSTFGK